MRRYLKASYLAAIRMFRTGDTEEAERLDAENSAILSEIHAKLESGQADYAFHRRKGVVKLYTRDLQSGRVRRTEFLLSGNGEFVPVTHRVFSDAAEMARDVTEFPHGGFLNVRRI